MNIFPEIDSKWYITDVLCNKHEAMVQHTYKCMAYFCLTHHFKLSKWNRFAQRRTALLLAKELIENSLDDFTEIKITPLDVYFVRTENKAKDSEIWLVHHIEPETQEVFIVNCLIDIILHE